MKIQADKNRSERELGISDMVYLKLQPYRHTSLCIHMCLKLHSKYYNPFRVIEKPTARRLLGASYISHQSAQETFGY
jgi:hypothetical protein